MTTQAIIYTRFSPRPGADECLSCEDQKARCHVFCMENNMKITFAFDDKAISGGILARPGLSDAMHYLAAGWVLVVDRPDRLSRDLLDTLLIRRQVEAAGATIEFADGSPSGSGSPEEIFFANIMAALAAYERARIVHRCKEGKKRSRKEGKFCGGKLKIGWRLNGDGKVVRCEVERDAIMYACQFTDESGSEAMARWLTSKFGKCRGKSWSARTIRKIIAREKYWAGPSGNMALEPTHP